MTIFDAIILGLVEGITEYLPVSSTGHLIIAAELLNLRSDNVNAFLIVIQGGAILAVLGLYRHRVAQMIRGLLGRDAIGLRLFLNILIAFVPAAMIGVFIDDWIDEHLFSFWPVVSALFLGGVLMIAIGPWQRRFFQEHSADDKTDSHRGPQTRRMALADPGLVDLEHLTWRRALLIGVLQCLAMWPGTSRSMVTIVGGMLVGMRPKHAAEFSFLLGLPTLGGACVWKLLKSYKGGQLDMLTDLGLVPCLVGIAVATVAAALAVHWLVSFLNRHGLSLFGWYRIVFAAALAGLVLMRIVNIGSAI